MQIAQQIKKKIAAEPNKIAVATKWAEDHTFGASDPAKLNSIYFMVYSDLNRMQAPGARMNDEAFRKYVWQAYLSLVVFEAMMMADLERCVNQAGRPAANALLGPRYAGLQTVYTLFPKTKIEGAWETALEFEASSGARPGNADICSNNLSETESGEGAGTVDAAYIDDAAWKAAREKTRAQLKTYWQQRYDAAAKKINAK